MTFASLLALMAMAMASDSAIAKPLSSTSTWSDGRRALSLHHGPVGFQSVVVYEHASPSTTASSGKDWVRHPLWVHPLVPGGDHDCILLERHAAAPQLALIVCHAEFYVVDVKKGRVDGPLRPRFRGMGQDAQSGILRQVRWRDDGRVLIMDVVDGAPVAYTRPRRGLPLHEAVVLFVRPTDGWDGVHRRQMVLRDARDKRDWLVTSTAVHRARLVLHEQHHVGPWFRFPTRTTTACPDRACDWAVHSHGMVLVRSNGKHRLTVDLDAVDDEETKPKLFLDFAGAPAGTEQSFHHIRQAQQFDELFDVTIKHGARQVRPTFVRKHLRIAPFHPAASTAFSDAAGHLWVFAPGGLWVPTPSSVSRQQFVRHLRRRARQTSTLESCLLARWASHLAAAPAEGADPKNRRTTFADLEAHCASTALP